MISEPQFEVEQFTRHQDKHLLMFRVQETRHTHQFPNRASSVHEEHLLSGALSLTATDTGHNALFDDCGQRLAKH